MAKRKLVDYSTEDNFATPSSKVVSYWRDLTATMRSSIALILITSLAVAGYAAFGLTGSANVSEAAVNPVATESAEATVASRAFDRDQASSRNAVRESLSTAVAAEDAEARSEVLRSTSQEVDKAVAKDASSARMRTLEEDLALVEKQKDQLIAEKKAAVEEFRKLSGISGYDSDIDAETLKKLTKSLTDNESSRIMKSGSYRLSAGFGSTGKWARYHTGMDFSAPSGTPIYAPVASVVGSSTGSSWAGTHVILHHKDGDSTLYAHMSSKVVKPGQLVLPGQLIGYVGSTGRSFGSHLHFEYYPQGTIPGKVYTAQNPRIFLNKYGINP